MCKKLTEQALQIERLHQAPDSLREIEQIKLEFKSKEEEVEKRYQKQLDELTRILVEQVAIQKQMKEQYTRKMNDMKVEQDTMLQMIMSADMTGSVALSMQRADDELNALSEMVREKHELLLVLGSTLEKQGARIRELEGSICLQPEDTGLVPPQSASGERATATHASDLDSAKQTIAGLQVALAEMQEKLNKVHMAAESREHDMCEELSLFRSVLHLTEDTVVKRDPSTNLVYFFTTSTGESRWARDHPAAVEYIPPASREHDIPTGAQSASPTPTKSAAAPALPENQRIVTDFKHPLPRGWMAMVDISTNQTYFFNKSTGESRWDMPGTKPKPPTAAATAARRSIFGSPKK